MTRLGWLVVCALSLILMCCFVAVNRYDMVAASAYRVVILDRLLGKAWLCDQDGCRLAKP